jgi:hypothetical protein
MQLENRIIETAAGRVFRKVKKSKRTLKVATELLSKENEGLSNATGNKLTICSEKTCKVALYTS